MSLRVPISNYNLPMPNLLCDCKKTKNKQMCAIDVRDKCAILMTCYLF